MILRFISFVILLFVSLSFAVPGSSPERSLISESIQNNAMDSPITSANNITGPTNDTVKSISDNTPVLINSNAPVILILGDSITANYGIDSKQGWPTILANRLENEPYNIINASISGETTSGGLSRLPALLERNQPQIVIIALGGNDGLRGTQIDLIKNNLAEMISLTKKNDAQVLLVGLQLPPNYGPLYTERFHELYQILAKQHDISLVPCFFAGFAENRDFFQADGIHPTADAQPFLEANVWKHLKPLLGSK